MNPVPIVLASSSPYRRALLARLRVPFEVSAPDVDERALPGEKPRETALRLAQDKARAVAARFPAALIIASDQVATLDGLVLGKPNNHENAVAQLRSLRGRSAVFHTALVVLNSARDAMQATEVPTTVHFRAYSDTEIERYLALEQPYDCTGSAKIEGLGIVLVERVVGDDPSALVGLPLVQLASMLRNEGVALP
jgi:septum formation protein